MSKTNFEFLDALGQIGHARAFVATLGEEARRLVHDLVAAASLLRLQAVSASPSASAAAHASTRGARWMCEEKERDMRGQFLGCIARRARRPWRRPRTEMALVLACSATLATTGPGRAV